MTGKIAQRRPLPARALLAAILEYRDGTLFWLRRPDSHFRTRKIANIWNAMCAGKRAGGPQSQGYRDLSIDGVRFLEHRVVYQLLHGGVEQQHEIDHIDGDKTNNRIENLRLCTHAENAMNQPGRRSNQKARHVYFSKREQAYKVAIRANGRRYHIGTYPTFAEATEAAQNARDQLHRDFQHRGGA